MQLNKINLPISYDNDKKFLISLTTKSGTKYWCWSYGYREVAELISNKILLRWLECPVQKYEDFSLYFVDKKDVVLTYMPVGGIPNFDWNKHDLNLKEASGI